MPAHLAITLTTGRRTRWVGWYLTAAGTAVAALWLVSLPGAFTDGLLSYAGTPDAGNIPIFHLLAEAVMALTALSAGIGLLRAHRHARPAALVANGMLAYSAINSSGWLLHNQPAVLPLTALTLAGAIAATVVLLRR